MILHPRYQTWDLPLPTLLISVGHHWRRVQICSLEDLSPAPTLLTSSGGHRNTYGCKAGSTHPSGMHSCLNCRQLSLFHPVNVTSPFITACNEVRARFLHVSVILFTEGVYISACWDSGPPRSRHPPGAYTPPEQTPPRADPPPAQCMLRDTANNRAVRILLECMLVYSNVPRAHWGQVSVHWNVLHPGLKGLISYTVKIRELWSLWIPMPEHKPLTVSGKRPRNWNRFRWKEVWMDPIFEWGVCGVHILCNNKPPWGPFSFLWQIVPTHKSLSQRKILIQSLHQHLSCRQWRVASNGGQVLF